MTDNLPAPPAQEPAQNRMVRMTREMIEEELSLYSRLPFRTVLADILECAPTTEALQAFANASPDKWANALKAVATIYGFTEKTEVVHDIRVTISRMSDSELLLKAAELRERAIIDVTPPKP